MKKKKKNSAGRENFAALKAVERVIGMAYSFDYRPFCTTDPVTPRGSYVKRPRVRVHPLNFLSEYSKKSRTLEEIEAFLRPQENLRPRSVARLVGRR